MSELVILFPKLEINAYGSCGIPFCNLIIHREINFNEIEKKEKGSGSITVSGFHSILLVS